MCTALKCLDLFWKFINLFCVKFDDVDGWFEPLAVQQYLSVPLQVLHNVIFSSPVSGSVLQDTFSSVFTVQLVRTCRTYIITRLF